MKVFLLTITAVFMSSLLFSQNPHLDFGKAVKFYNMTSFEKEQHTVEGSGSLDDIVLTYSDWQILSPSIAFQWKSTDVYFHEVELNYLKLDKESNTVDMYDRNSNTIQQTSKIEMIETLISAQYEFMKYLFRSSGGKLVPAISVGFNPYYSRYTIKSDQDELRQNQSIYGAKIYITPRLNYFISEKLFLDLNIPICLVHFYYLSENSYEPYRRNTPRVDESEYKSLPKIYLIRVGLGFKI